MARRKQSPSSSHSEAFPSSPRRPPTIGIYITHEDKQTELSYVTFSKTYAAAAFVQDCIELHGRPDAVESSGGGKDLIFETGWHLSTRDNSQTNDLEQLIKYNFTPAEADFTIPQEVKDRYKILGGRKDRPLDEVPQGHDGGRTRDKENVAKRPASRPDGLITLASFASDPGEARKILRKASFAKPAHGWSWPEGHPDIAKVKKLIG